MIDVEQLLRDTLADPRRRLDAVPGMYDRVLRNASERRRRKATIVAAGAAVTAVAVVGAIVGTQRSHRPTQAGSAAAASGPSRGSLGAALNLGNGTVVAQAATATSEYVLTDAFQLVRFAPSRSDVQTAAPAPKGTPQGVAADDERVWAWSQDSASSRTMIDAYAPTSLAHVGSLSEPGTISNAVAVGDDLYVTVGGGLLRITVSSNGVAASGQLAVSGNVDGLTAEPVRNRLLVSTAAPGSAPPSGLAGDRIVAIDPKTGKTEASSAQTGLAKDSLAIVADQVWLGGYGDTSHPRVVHLDSATLEVIGTSAVDDEVGPGALIWAGQNVVWVRNGGNEGLSCVDPQSGAILEQWPDVEGPVASSNGFAYAMNNGLLQRLTLLGGCTG